MTTDGSSGCDSTVEQTHLQLEGLVTERPGGLQSIGLQRVGHDWSDLARVHAHICHVVGATVFYVLQESEDHHPDSRGVFSQAIWSLTRNCSGDPFSSDGLIILYSFSREKPECRVMGFVSEFFVWKESGGHSGTQVQYKLTMPGKGTHLRLYSWRYGFLSKAVTSLLFLTHLTPCFLNMGILPRNLQWQVVSLSWGGSVF